MPSRSATSATPGASGSARARAPAAPRSPRARWPGVGGEPVGEVDHRAAPRRPQRPSLGKRGHRTARTRRHARLGLGHVRARDRRAPPAPRRRRRARPVTPTRSPGSAPARASSSRSAPAQPTTVDRHDQDGRRHDVAARDRGPRLARERVRAAHQLERAPLGETGRAGRGEVRLAGVARPSPRDPRARRPARGGPPRRGVAQPASQAEVHALDHRVDRARTDSPAARDHRRVVADPEHQSAPAPRGTPPARLAIASIRERSAMASACR